MTVIHLDTSFLVRASTDDTPESAVLEVWINDQAAIEISSVAWCEFLAGPLAPGDLPFAKELVGLPLPFLTEDAELASEFFNLTNRRRGTMADCMIAAAAVRRGAKLATCNLRDFRRLEPHGLVLA